MSKELEKMWSHLTPKQQQFVLKMAMQRGFDPLSGGNFFGKLFKSVIKPLGKKLVNEVAIPIVRNVAQKKVESSLGLGPKGKGTTAAKPRKPRKKKVVGSALSLAGRGVSKF